MVAIISSSQSLIQIVSCCQAFQYLSKKYPEKLLLTGVHQNILFLRNFRSSRKKAIIFTNKGFALDVFSRHDFFANKRKQSPP